jgi:CDP-paratose 2-epimerase
MSVAIVTGSGGLVGSETARFLSEQGMDVVGIDNDMRSYFFGPEASTRWNVQSLLSQVRRYSHREIDVRDRQEVDQLFRSYGSAIQVVIHAAAQPSHDWAAKEPFTDFSINADGTLVMLEALRRYSPDAVFIFTSTNKVYGDAPNSLPLVEHPTRWEVDASHPYSARGIDEHMPIDASKHSLFGVSKLAADVLTQEYGRYFGLRTGVFRGGCLTGPAHSGAELHGFLGYLVKCAMLGRPYKVYGYKGKQVRDNIHSYDLVSAFWEFLKKPQCGEVYNIGGSRHINCSVLEAIQMVSDVCGRRLEYSVSDEARPGDHIWWISDVGKFRSHYPSWNYKYDLVTIVSEIRDAIAAREAGTS